MQLQTPVSIRRGSFAIEPRERMLFVGSCFADNIGRRFQDDRFRATVNPYGVMYNPASILHTVERYLGELDAAGTSADEYPATAVFTLGTNHVYILNETGEIVDNCRKRPQRLFTERELSVDECAGYIASAIGALRLRRPDARVVITVSPIRYAKYGFHGSMLSKAALLLAADRVVKQYGGTPMGGDGAANGCGGGAANVCAGGGVEYFPAYEIVNDELRDYRFYREDMLHPTDQAVAYIHQRFADTYFSERTRQFLERWKPIRAALAHRPFNPDSEEYKAFLAKARADEQRLMEEYE